MSVEAHISGGVVLGGDGAVCEVVTAVDNLVTIGAYAAGGVVSVDSYTPGGWFSPDAFWCPGYNLDAPYSQVWPADPPDLNQGWTGWHEVDSSAGQLYIDLADPFNDEVRVCYIPA